MSVVKMQKVRIIGLIKDREELFEQLQKLEFIHLKDFEEGTLDEYFSSHISVENEERKLTEEISHIESTLTYIEQFNEDKSIVENLFPPKVEIDEEEFKKTVRHSNYKEIVRSINEVKEKIAKIDERISALNSDITFLLPFKNLSWIPADFKETQTTNSLFAKGLKEKHSKLNERFQKIGGTSTEIISSESDFIYMLLISWKENNEQVSKALKDEGFEIVNLSSYDKIPSEVVSSNRKNIEALYKEKGTLIKKIKQTLKHRDELMIVYDWYLYQLQRERAKKKFRESEQTFVLQGWIRRYDREKIEKFFKNKFPATYIESISPDKEEVPPIEARNSAIVRPFQAVTNLFGLPHFGEVDPAGLVAPFFFVFFGLCIADVGYGIVLIALTLFAMKKITIGKEGKQFFYLFLLGGFSAILWGIVTGGWFGIEVAKLPPILKKPILFNPLEDLMIFFILAICLGVIQVFFGIGVEAYEQLREKNFAAALSDHFSFIIILAGTILWMISKQGLLSRQFGKTGLLIMISGGVIMAVSSLFKKDRNPILELIISIGGVAWKAKDFLGNVLSYSRLMALGLAGGVIAFVINTFAGMALQIPYLGILVALFIIIVGHMANILINTLGAFIHTARLQFVEFFSYFFQGGGEAFQPLSQESRYIIPKGKRSPTFTGRRTGGR